ncbi:MAG: zinc-dependent metalloprotease [Solirubrobacterales bacterium]|nr:zinc-dependent metalloprotease [Solirubrobacterales bacterium]
MRSCEAVVDYTRLTPAGPVPEAEWVSRREWARINLASMREMVAAVEGRVGGSLAPGRAGQALDAVGGRAFAVQIGGLLGLASRRVLGQYEMSLLGDERRPRLIFVGPNIDSAASDLGGAPGDVLEWVALHEVTHAVHFTSVPWLGDHLGELARTLLEDTPLSLEGSELLGGARQALSDPRSWINEIRGADPVSLLAPPQARETIASVQATMALVEGYAEHVMDAAATELGPRVRTLRAGMERRRENRGPLARTLAWLLGLEMKLRQYRDGKQFADEVVAAEGIGGLNLAWDGPDALPTLAEIAAADEWMRRVGAPAAA